MDIIIFYIITAVVCGVFLYVKIRPLFHIRANCWFCNKDCIVPYLNRNSFHCPYCQQYNGFLPDGGYNRVIPAQHNELLNNTAKFANTPTKHVLERESNGLCAKCNLIQELKIRLLSSFVPIKESRYNVELSMFKQHLEEVCRLCAQCESAVNKFLAKLDSYFFNSVHALRHSHKETLSPKSWFCSSAFRSLLHCVVVFGALVLNTAKILYTEEGRQFVPYVDTEESMCPAPPVTLSVVLATEFYWIMLGMFIQMFVTVLNGLKWIDMSCSFSWALLFIFYSCISTDYINEMHLRTGCVFISAAVILFSASSLFLVLFKPDSTNSSVWKTAHDDTDFIQKWNRTRTFRFDTPPTVLGDEYSNGALSSTRASCSSYSKLNCKSGGNVKSKILVKKAASSQELNINNLKKTEIEDLEYAFSIMNTGETVKNFHPDGSLLKPSRLTNMKNKSEKTKIITSLVGVEFGDKYNACQTIVNNVKPFSDTQTLFSTPTHSRSSNKTSGYFPNRASPLNSSNYCFSVNNHIPRLSNYQLSPLGPPQVSPLGPSCSPPPGFSVPYMSGTYVHTVISRSPVYIHQNMFSFPFPSSSVPGFHKY